jgi:hypothetical protein
MNEVSSTPSLPCACPWKRANRPTSAARLVRLRSKHMIKDIIICFAVGKCEFVRLLQDQAGTDLRGLDVDFVVAIHAVDHVGDEPCDDEDTNDYVAENTKIIIQRGDGAPKATVVCQA